jgi:putative membrane protein
VTAGSDPDSRTRTHLANERTFLAWFRTGVTLIALGLAGGQLLAVGSVSELASLMAVVVVVAGIGLLLIGRARYVRSRKLIDAADYRPAGMSVDFSVAMFVLAGALAIAFIIFGMRP